MLRFPPASMPYVGCAGTTVNVALFERHIPEVTIGGVKVLYGCVIHKIGCSVFVMISGRSTVAPELLVRLSWFASSLRNSAPSFGCVSGGCLASSTSPDAIEWQTVAGGKMTFEVASVKPSKASN